MPPVFLNFLHHVVVLKPVHHVGGLHHQMPHAVGNCPV